jgi:tetratricopeptide (TPR) repeat protein
MFQALLLVGLQSLAPAASDGSDTFKFEYYRVKERLESDGSIRRTMEVSVILRAPSAVAQFGQLGLPYVKDYGDVQFNQVRVHRPDGTSRAVADAVLEDLNPLGINDASIPIDVRYKKLTIPRLEPGDKLSYSVLQTQKPFVPGDVSGEVKFWPLAIDGPRTYELDVPAQSRIRVELRPGLGASWETVPSDKDRLVRRLSISVPAQVIKESGMTEEQVISLQTPDVSYSTFSSWSDVGSWWWRMSQNQVLADDPIRAEAAKLTAGKATPRDKIEALAAFVGTTVRYLNLSFGAGRMQPRTAASVLATRFGDCKDKVGLLMALAQTVGIEVRPVLINASRQNLLDASPGPHQFDHVIAVAKVGPVEKDWMWIDPTTALTPLALMPPTRDKRALLIEPSGGGVIVRTPAVPDRARAVSADLTAKLDESGVMKGRVRLTTRSDNERGLRNAFAGAAREQHPEMVKAILARTWKDSRVSNVRIADLSNLTNPFWFEFDFERDVPGVDSSKEWKLWVPDMGPSILEAEDDATATKLALFTASEESLTASVELPTGITARAPLSVSLDRPFASVSSNYSVDGRTLKVSRIVRFPQPFLSREQLPAYQALKKSADTDREQEFVIGPITMAAPSALALQKEGQAAREKKDWTKAVDLLQRASTADPKLKDVYLDLGLAHRGAKRNEEAVAAFTKAIEADPFHESAYAERAHTLFDFNREAEAEKDLLKQIEVAPFKTWSYARLAELRDRQKRYLDAAELYSKALAVDGSNVSQWLEAGWSYVRGGKPEESRRAYEKALSLGLKAPQRVQAAFGYRQMGDLKTAASLAQEDLAEVSKNVGLITPKNMSSTYLYWVKRLAHAWLIIGEEALEAKEIQKAEKYLKASWELGFLPNAAFALGRIREEQGQLGRALELWSAAATLSNWDIRPSDLSERIDKLRKGDRLNDGSQEMARLRFIKIPGSSTVNAEAEVLVLASGGKVTGALNSSKKNVTELAPALDRLIGQPVSLQSPDESPVTVLRAGMVVCSQRAGCQFIANIEGAAAGPGRDFGEISIVKISPADKSTIRVGEVVHLIVNASYNLTGTEEGEVALVVSTDSHQSLLKPQPRRKVASGKGVVEFDVEFKVPADAKAVRVFLPLSAGRASTTSVTSAEFTVKP